MPVITIPKPLLLTVDDVGWWCGRDGSAWNEPFRTGMPRDHFPDDYRALAALGKALGMRIPIGLVLCEWDASRLLRELPSATWMGNQWQAPFQDPAGKEEAAGIIAGAASFLEPALHGLGHEFWINGRLDRSEFHSSDGGMRPADEVKKHLEYFFRLLALHRIDTGVRLFIPPALNHSFGNGDEGFQEIARTFGIRYVTLLFHRARCHMSPQYGTVGWENQVVLMNRGRAPIAWDRMAPEPEFNPEGPLLPLHWANLLHENPQKNMGVVSAWVTAIEQKIKENNLIPAMDIAHCLTQFLNHTRSTVRPRGREVIVRMDWVHEVPASALADSVFFQIEKAEDCRIDIIGTHEIPPANSRQEKFLRLKLPKSGKIVFRFSNGDI